MSKKPTAITANAYAQFIELAVEAHGGRIEETKLNQLIEEKYKEHWTETDKAPWGKQHHPKYRQNVASAKSGLDRRGIIIKFETCRLVKGKGRRVVKSKTVWRVATPEAFVVNAIVQWSQRFRSVRKKQYERLDQPEGRFIVPDVFEEEKK